MIELVPATEADGLVVDAFLLQLHNQHAIAHPDYYKMDPNSFFSKEKYLANLKEGNTILILAKQASIAVGLLWAERKIKQESKLQLSRKELWLEGIVVDQHCQRQGIGTMLLEELFAIAANEAFDSVELMVWNDNAEAMSIYHKCFKPRTQIMTKSLR